jgi:DNA-binding transcriptional MerR regulator
MQKLYYSISELSELIDEEQHILRYWEKEFEQFKPKKNRSGNRIYSEKDLNIAKIIKMLLRDEKLSLKGAKEKLKFIINKQNEPDDNLFLNTIHPDTGHSSSFIKASNPDNIILLDSNNNEKVVNNVKIVSILKAQIENLKLLKSIVQQL